MRKNGYCPCLSEPEKYSHLKGNFEAAWQNQQKAPGKALILCLAWGIDFISEPVYGLGNPSSRFM